jgi:osmoprotectant transport system permease protein
MKKSSVWRAQVAPVLVATLVGLGAFAHALRVRAAVDRDCIRVASKPFTESYVLSEIVAQLIEETGETAAERKFGLGGPTLVVDALKSGDIDVDVNYTGALSHEFVKHNPNATIAELRAALGPFGITLGESLGFNNTYAIAVRSETASRMQLAKISDLRGHPELRGAFTPDFLNFEDGFYRLQEVYGIKLGSVKPMQHSLAYEALRSRQIDLTDAYTTDGTLSQFDLTLLEDDQNYFPKYYGVIAIRTQSATRFPRTWAALRQLEGKFSDKEMTRLNAIVDKERRPIEEVARSFLLEHALVRKDPKAGAGGAAFKLQIDEGLWVSTYEHFSLVMLALILSCVVGIPLGIVAYQYRRLGHLLVAATGLLQTIPSLALLCFLIPFLGIGAMPTICTLFIYGLLPIVQSTSAGLFALDPKLVETAKILGLSRLQRLRLIEVPLASINIMAGVKTTAVINVATATIAALIGAGGYGRYITSGLAMNDNAMILKGAIPTAVMAVAFHGLCEGLSRIIVPRGLRR